MGGGGRGNGMEWCCGCTLEKLYRGHEEQFADILLVLWLYECRGVLHYLGFGDDTVSNVLKSIDFGEDPLSVPAQCKPRSEMIGSLFNHIVRHAC